MNTMNIYDLFAKYWSLRVQYPDLANSFDATYQRKEFTTFAGLRESTNKYYADMCEFISAKIKERNPALAARYEWPIK